MSTKQAARAAVMKSSGLNVLLLLPTAARTAVMKSSGPNVLLLPPTELKAKFTVPWYYQGVIMLYQVWPADAGAADLTMCHEGASSLYLLQTGNRQHSNNVTESRLAQPIRLCCMQTSASKGSDCTHARQARAACERAYFLGSQRLGSATNRVRSYCIKMSLISLLLCSSTSAMQCGANS
jgi:hypothetical protein